MPDPQPFESPAPAAPDQDITTSVQSGGVNLQGESTVHGDVVGRDTTTTQNINTGGGAHVESGVNAGGNFVGRDEIKRTTNIKVSAGGLIAGIAVIGMLIVAVLVLVRFSPPALSTPSPFPSPYPSSPSLASMVTLSPSITETPIPAPSPTSTLAPSETPGIPTTTPTEAPTATPTAGYLGPDCIAAGNNRWTYYPPSDTVVAVDGCWKTIDFLPQIDGMRLERVTLANSGEQQRGFYTLLQGDTDIQFTVRIHEFATSAEQFTDGRFNPNLAFGITDTSSRFTYLGVLLYYYASSPSNISYEIGVSGGSSFAYHSAIDKERDQLVKFTLSGNTLSIYIDDLEHPVASGLLYFDKRAFYLGYRLAEKTALRASISNFLLHPVK